MDRTFFEYQASSDDWSPIEFHRETHTTHSAFFDPHWHLNMEILYFIRGKAIVQCGVRKYEVSPGDTIVVNSCVSHTASIVDGDVEYYCLIPDREFCSLNGLNTDVLSVQEYISDDKITELIQNIVKEYELTDFSGKIGFHTAVFSLLIYLSRHYSLWGGNVKKSDVKEAIRLTVGYIYNHSEEPLSIDRLAQEAGFSKYHFLREFKKNIGENPVVFIHKLRCDNAKKLLQSETISLQSICDRVGFKSTSYLIKIFKKYVGCTPATYRREQRRLQESKRHLLSPE